jgi:hypothetical protein
MTMLTYRSQFRPHLPFAASMPPAQPQPAQSQPAAQKPAPAKSTPAAAKSTPAPAVAEFAHAIDDNNPLTHPDTAGLASTGKKPIQHIAEMGFVLASGAAILGPLGRVGQMVPGLNLAVGGVMAYNGVHYLRQKQHTAALGCIGNALGCFASTAEDAGRLVSIFGGTGKPHAPYMSSAVSGGIVALGMIGGTCGLIQGIREIRAGLEIKAHNGSTRVLHMGIADTLSGTATLVGIGLRLTGWAPGIGTGLIIGASLCDMASVAVDYFDRKHDKEAHRGPIT